MLTVDLMLEQLQRERNLANARVKLEQEKKKLDELKPQTQKGEEEASGEAEAPYVKPVTDKRGKTIERPNRPL